MVERRPFFDTAETVLPTAKVLTPEEAVFVAYRLRGRARIKRKNAASAWRKKFLDTARAYEADAAECDRLANVLNPDSEQTCSG